MHNNALFVPHIHLLSVSEEAMSGVGPEYAEMLESICGATDDSQAVELYDGTLGVTTAFVAARQQPAVQVQWNDNLATAFTSPGNVNGVRWGSGTMISADLMLTCGHLFDQNPGSWVVPRRNGTAISSQEIALNMHVNFLYQVDSNNILRAEQRFAITQLIEFRLGGIDMAVCRIAGSPGATYGWTEVSASNPVVGDMLAIIGHPAGVPKRIEAGTATTVSANQITYDDIDTLGGNSGSGIIHSTSGRLVGVHTNGGCNPTGGSNSGVAIAAIQAVSPTLQVLATTSHTARAADTLSTFASDVLTIHAADSHTSADVLGTARTRDIFGTNLGLDTRFDRDALGTGLAADVGTKFAGDVGTLGSGDDPTNTWVEGIDDPANILINPAIPGVVTSALGGARPFVQAGPHTPIGQESVEVASGQVESSTMLDDLEAAIATQRLLLERLEATYLVLRDAVEGNA